MLSGGRSKNNSKLNSERKSVIDAALKKKTTQVRSYVVALKNKKLIRWWWPSSAKPGENWSTCWR